MLIFENWLCEGKTQFLKNIEAILTSRFSRKAVDSSSILMASTWLQWRKLVDVISEIFSVQYIELGKVQKEWISGSFYWTMIASKKTVLFCMSFL